MQVTGEHRGHSRHRAVGRRGGYVTRRTCMGRLLSGPTRSTCRGTDAPRCGCADCRITISRGLSNDSGGGAGDVLATSGADFLRCLRVWGGSGQGGTPTRVVVAAKELSLIQRAAEQGDAAVEAGRLSARPPGRHMLLPRSCIRHPLHPAPLSRSCSRRGSCSGYAVLRGEKAPDDALARELGAMGLL
jgi:hypothetical protein